MTRSPTRYALLRDRRSWPDCALTGLDADADGRLWRRRVPGPADGVPVDLPGPYAPAPSGVAAGDGFLAVAETSANRLRLRDTLCGGVEYVFPDPRDAGGLGTLSAPAGLAIAGDRLWAADSGNGWLVCYDPEERQIVATLDGLDQPTAVALDGEGRILVLESGAGRLRRFHPWLAPDDAFNARIISELAVAGRLPGPFDPRFMAVAADGVVYVSEGSTGAVLRFGSDGGWLAPLVLPGGAPGALVVGPDALYVADVGSGRLLEIRLADGETQVLPNVRAPAAGLALSDKGALLLLTDAAGTLVTLAAGAARLPEGSVTTGPIDAGEAQEWFRVVASVDAGAGGAVALDVWQTDDPTVAPKPADWLRAPADSALLAPLADPSFATRRFLWLRATLAGTPTEAGPALEQIAAQTPGEDWLAYLPALYGKADRANGFLARLLAHAQDQFLGLEERIDGVASVFSADFAAAETLDWLAGWLGYETPLRLGPDQKRRLLTQIVALQDRRGAPAAIAAAVELETGVRPLLHEAFRDRRIWILDADDGFGLGFDTRLPPADPNGLVVADAPQAEAAAFPTCATAVGGASVGETQPQAQDMWGTALFDDTAHLFRVTLPAEACRPELIDAVRAVVEREKPAHTDFVLCAAPDGARLDPSTQIGAGAVVALPAPPARLGDTPLDRAFILGGASVPRPRFSPATNRAGGDGTDRGAKP